MPSRWSISCWRQRASKPSVSIRSGSPSGSQPRPTISVGAPDVRGQVGDAEAAFARDLARPSREHDRGLTSTSRPLLLVARGCSLTSTARSCTARRAAARRARRSPGGRASCRRRSPATRSARPASSSASGRARPLQRGMRIAQDVADGHVRVGVRGCPAPAGRNVSSTPCCSRTASERAARASRVERRPAAPPPSSSRTAARPPAADQARGRGR